MQSTILLKRFEGWLTNGRSELVLSDIIVYTCTDRCLAPSYSIIYWDLNSANVGFDEYGILRLFKDQAMASSESIRYMAPEEIQSKDHGADVYSFGILVWEIMSNHHQAFSSINKAEKLAKLVVQKRKRPNLSKMITNKEVLPQGSQLFDMVNQCCSHDPRDRPSIETVCKMIESEIALLYCDTIQ